MCTGLTEFRLCALALIAVLAIACNRPAPVASLAAEPPRVKIEYGRCAPVTLEWSKLRPPAGATGRPVVFVHLHDGKRLVRSFDHPANWPWRPGTSWIEQLEICQSALASPVPPGNYVLRVGVYDSDSGKRWPLATELKEVADHAYKVADVEVAGRVPLPDVKYRGLWSPVRRRVGDGQIPSTRWLHRDGSILVRGGRGQRLHLEVSVKDSPLLITHGGTSHRLEAGRQTWHVALAADEETIQFAPVLTVAPRQRTVTIESLAFHR